MNLCSKNYYHSHMAILFQWILLGLNISQLLFHHFGMPEPKITPKRFDLDYVFMRQHFGSGMTRPAATDDFD